MTEYEWKRLQAALASLAASTDVVFAAGEVAAVLSRRQARRLAARTTEYIRLFPPLPKGWVLTVNARHALAAWVFPLGETGPDVWQEIDPCAPLAGRAVMASDEAAINWAGLRVQAGTKEEVAEDGFRSLVRVYAAGRWAHLEVPPAIVRPVVRSACERLGVMAPAQNAVLVDVLLALPVVAGWEHDAETGAYRPVYAPWEVHGAAKEVQEEAQEVQVEPTVIVE